MSDMQKSIETKLQESFNPTYLEVVNESYKHKGHSGDDGSGESHFVVTISSAQFNDMSRVDRERSVFSVLEKEMKKIHALSVRIK